MNTPAAIVDYEIIALADGTWSVKVIAAGEMPRTVTGFQTREEAEAWMYADSEKPGGNQGLPGHI